MNDRSHKLIQLKGSYFDYLDRKARHLAFTLKIKRNVTKLILDYIKELYKSANIEKAYNNESFESAYHNPVSSDMEFLISRMLYHYSNLKNLGWKIYLRRQVGKTAPDIRITNKKDKTIAIIEMKANVGWMQSVFSRDTYIKEMKKHRSGKGLNPKESIKKAKQQIVKYHKTFEIPLSRIFIFLPALSGAHRSKSDNKIDDYKSFYSKNTGLPKNNVIVLSGELKLNLDKKADKLLKRNKYKSTGDFEALIKKLSKMK